MFSDHNEADDLGVVYKKTIGTYFVHSDGRVIPCGLSNKLRKELIYPIADPSSLPHRVRAVLEKEHTDPVAIGDVVHFIDAGDGSGLIREVLPRRNHLSRQTAVPMPDAKPFEQVIVANADQVVPVFSAAAPAPKWNLLDRYLVLSESAGIPALVCINKIDLVQGRDGQIEDEALLAAVEEYCRIGYPVLLMSATTGEGLDALKEALAGQVSVLLGKSGVGKTSLLNALEPGLGLKVNEVNRASKGRHTTTHLEMFPLAMGGAIVDTPGVRELGLWQVDVEDLALYFPEMRPYVGQCRFRLDCKHDEEPGCAIRRAVTAGQISANRFASYLKLRDET